MNAPLKYGTLVGGVVFFVGWITGMGGSLLPNLGFSILMGLLAGGLYWLASNYANRS